MSPQSGKRISTNALLVSAVYAAVSLAWIVFSDRVLKQLATTTEAMTLWSSVKGSVFVTASAALIYFLMSRIGSMNRTLAERVEQQTAELRRSQTRYRRVLETAQEGVWVVDRYDRTEFVNQPMASMLGLSAEEMRGSNPLEYVAPDWQPAASRDLKGQTAFSSLELKLRRTDGSELWASASRGLLFDEQGQYDGSTLLVSDITEQRRAEDQLRLQATAVNAAANGIVITDPNGMILWVNPAFTATTGYQPQEVIGESTRILKSGEHDAGFYANLWNTIKSGRVWQGEMVNRHKDGHRYWEEMTIAPVHSREGTITHFVAIKQDVTARNQALDALRRSEERFRRLVENISDGILAADAEGRIEYASESACHVSGYPRQQLVGRNLFQFIHTDDVVAVQELFQHVVRERGSTVQWGARIRHKDGTWRYFEGSTANRLEDPDIAAMIINFRDGTARRETEQALVLAEERYRAIFENATIGIYLSSPQGQYLSMNKTLAATYGYESPEEAIRNLAVVSRKYLDKGKWEEFRSLLASTGHVTDFEYAVERRDGTHRWLLESARGVHGDNGRLLYHEGVVRDITDRKSLEVQLRQAQKLEAVGRLAGGVAHDFNNMLGVILGYGDILQSQLPPEHPGIKSAIEMQKAARRAADLTRQLLAFSRKQILQPQVVNLNSLIEELSKMLRRLIGENIELLFHGDPAVARVKADPGQLEQVVMNLAVNARDAMPGGGRLGIETGNVVIDEAFARQHEPMRAGEYVLLSITDTGSGMAPDVITHIFEPFFTTKEQGKGTGLGLSIVYGIVKQSGGYIWVDSELNRGTTFRIYLPPTTEAATVGALQRRTSPIGGNETILIVEDDDSIREMMRIVLAQAGYNIIEARNGDEALSSLPRMTQPVHLLVTDVIMPGTTSGWDLARAVNATHPEIHILFMTGFGIELDTFGMEVDPTVLLITKPFSADLLVGKVREALDRGHGSMSASTSR
jgi:two-component system cell cycle sensor histidine kinase/response regulator CckA